MKIIYLSPYDILRPRTNQISDLRFCEAFADNGCEVELFVPFLFRDDNLDKESIFKFYDVQEFFRVNYIKSYSKHNIKGKGAFAWIAFKMFWNGWRKILKNNSERIIVLSRYEPLLLLFIFYKKLFKKRNIQVIPWLHDFRIKRINRFLYKNADFIIATNSSILADLHKVYKYPLSRTAVTLNPISKTQLKERVSKNHARSVIGYRSGKPLIVYTGKLFKGQKEIEYILNAACKLPEYHFLFTGGKPDVIDFYSSFAEGKKIKNCEFTGYIPDYSRIKYYQAAADLLISYYTDDIHDVRYNLPNKLCEYMLTGNPIVTPNFPATRDLLNSENAFFVEPENSESLAARIQEIFNDYEKARIKGDHGFTTVTESTYNKMVLKILEMVEKEDL